MSYETGLYAMSDLIFSYEGAYGYSYHRIRLGRIHCSEPKAESVEEIIVISTDLGIT